MSPSRGEKLDGRQRGAVNSRRASSLVACASGNVVRTFAARASAADAAINDCHAPAVDTAPIVAAGSSAADGDRALRKCPHGKCASPQDEGDRGIGPLATGARERLAVFPQQAIRRDLGSIFHKTGGTDSEHAHCDGAIPADVATTSGAAPALRQSAGKNTMKAGATKNIKVVVRRRLGNTTSLNRLYVPMDMASTFMPPLPSLHVCGKGKKEARPKRSDQRGGDGQPGGRFAGEGAGGAGSKAAAASNFYRRTVTFAVMAEAGPLRVGTGSGAPVVDNDSSGPAFTNDTNSVPVFSNDTNSGPAFASDTNSGPAFANNANSGPAFANNINSDPVAKNTNSVPAFANDTISGPASANNANSGHVANSINNGPVANNRSSDPADDDADLEQPTEGGEEKLATSATYYDVEYERRHFGDQVHHRLTKGWHTLCLVLEAGVGDTLEMTRYRSRGDQDLEDDYHRQNTEETGVDHGDEDAGPAAGSSSVIFVRVVN